jgi:hypothetical protein
MEKDYDSPTSEGVLSPNAKKDKEQDGANVNAAARKEEATID